MATTADDNTKQAQEQALSANNLAITAKANADKATADATKAMNNANQAVTVANTANEKADNAVTTANASAQKVDLMDVQVQKHNTQINAVQNSLVATAQKVEQTEIIDTQARSSSENAARQAEQTSQRVVTLTTCSAI